MLLIGSAAARHWFDIDRVPVDVDYICTYEEMLKFIDVIGVQCCYPINSGKKFVGKLPRRIYEFEIAWPGTTAEELLKLDTGSASVDFNGLTISIANIDTLYALKMSHRYLKNNPHFLKTMRDIHEMREHGAVIRPEMADWFKRREAETYTYSHPVLNQDKRGFFSGDGVNYVYDHDELHEAVKHLDKPAYKFYQKDGAEVMTDKAKFFSIDEKVRLYGVLEEAYVLALERHQIPNHFKPNPEVSFRIALEKICTSITSGWFREYAWEHYDQVIDMYSDAYVGKFMEHFDIGMSIEQANEILKYRV